MHTTIVIYSARSRLTPLSFTIQLMGSASNAALQHNSSVAQLRTAISKEAYRLLAQMDRPNHKSLSGRQQPIEQSSDDDSDYEETIVDQSLRQNRPQDPQRSLNSGMQQLSLSNARQSASPGHNQPFPSQHRGQPPASLRLSQTFPPHYGQAPTFPGHSEPSRQQPLSNNSRPTPQGYNQPGSQQYPGPPNPQISHGQPVPQHNRGRSPMPPGRGQPPIQQSLGANQRPPPQHHRQPGPQQRPNQPPQQPPSEQPGLRHSQPRFHDKRQHLAPSSGPSPSSHAPSSLLTPTRTPSPDGAVAYALAAVSSRKMSYAAALSSAPGPGIVSAARPQGNSRAPPPAPPSRFTERSYVCILILSRAPVFVWSADLDSNIVGHRWSRVG